MREDPERSFHDRRCAGGLLLLLLFTVICHDGVGGVHVLEHALQLLSKGRAALHLYLGNHEKFGLSTSTAVEQQASRQIPSVESLEDVFGLEVAKQKHNLA